MSQNASPSTPSSPGQAAGLAGVTVANSSICFIDGQKGDLVYRGYNIHDLAGAASFEETAALLWDGELPGRTRLDELKSQFVAARALPKPVVAATGSLPAGAGSMETMRSAVSLLSSYDPDTTDMSVEANRRKAVRLTGAMTTILAGHVRRQSGQEPVAPRADLDHAANFLWMMTGSEPSATAAQAFDTALVLHAEHGFNASTFSARVTAATLSDLHSAVVAAIGTLKGPLHGGANRAVMKMLEEIGSVSAVETDIKARLARKEKIMGFGHRVYKTMDPRAIHLKKMAEDLGRDCGEPLWYDMSARMEEVVMQEKGLYPNVDFYSAAAYRYLEIPPAIFPAVFACSRITGWTAHILEQYSDNRLIRPRSQYVGPKDRTFQPLDERG